MRSESDGSALKRITDEFRELYNLLKNEKFFKILGITSVIILGGALSIFFADRFYHTKGVGGASLMPSIGLW